MSRFARCNCPAGVSAPGEHHAPCCPSYSGITAPMAAMMAVSKLRPIAMTEQTKLLPCPFCGGDAESRLYDGTYFVQCILCFNSTAADYQHEDNAIAAWNRRAAPVQGVVVGGLDVAKDRFEIALPTAQGEAEKPYAYHFLLARGDAQGHPAHWSNELEFELPDDALLYGGRVRNIVPLYTAQPKPAQVGE